MAKTDINFIKYMKPQLKEKEQRDKEYSRRNKYDKYCRDHNIEQPVLTSDDIGILAGLLRQLKGGKN